MTAASALPSLLQLVYQAASDAQHWPAFLEQCQRILDSRNIAMGYSPPDRERAFMVATGADEDDLRRYHSYHCPWLDRLVAENWQDGGADASHHLITDAELERTQCFSEFLGPRNFQYGMGAAIQTSGPGPALLVVLREKHKGPYADEDLAFLRLLLPHMSQALKLYGRITSLETSRRGLAESLDRVASGLLILDADGRVLFVNRAAQRIVAEDDGLSIARDGLRAALSQETVRLRRLVASAAQTTNGHGGDAGGELLLSRPSFRRPLALSVSPLPQDSLIPGLPGVAAVAVFVNDPESASEGDGDLLSRLYGLTPAECRLATTLNAGEDLRVAADSLGVSYHTARAQMKSIFGKTGTRRQAELVRLLSRLPVRA